MKKLLIALLMFGTFFITHVNINAEETKDFEVTYTARFDDENTGITQTIEADYADRITLDDKVDGEDSQYHFAFWIVDGQVRKELPVDHSFIVTGDMDIEAVFSKDGEHAVLFMDSNAELLDIQFVGTGNDAVDIESESFLETFDDSNATGSYSDGSFESSLGITWEYYHARDEGDYPIDGDGIMLRRSDEPSTLKASFSEGLSEFSFDTRKAFTGDTQRQLKVTIEHSAGTEMFEYGEETLDFSDGEDDTVINVSEENLNILGDFTLKIEVIGPTGNRQITIDNFEWTNNVLPSKPNMLISETAKWSQSINGITDDKVVFLQYEIDTTETYELTVENGNGSGIYTYNDIATVTPDEAASGETFSHWELDGNIVSYEEEFSISIFHDKTLEAIFLETPENPESIMRISESLELRSNQNSFVGQFELHNDHELIEYGFILSDELQDLDYETGERYRSSKFYGPTGEFMSTFSRDFETAIAYMVVENTLGDLEYIYSNQVYKTYTEYFEQDDISGSYHDGTYSGTLNWSYTESRDAGSDDIDGGGIMLRGLDDPDYASVLETTFTDGLNSLSFDYRKGFSGNAEYRVIIENDYETLMYDLPSFNPEDGIQNFSISNLGLVGETTLTIKALNDQQGVFNNFEWNYYRPANSLSFDHNDAGTDSYSSN